MEPSAAEKTKTLFHSYPLSLKEWPITERLQGIRQDDLKLAGYGTVWAHSLAVRTPVATATTSNCDFVILQVEQTLLADTDT